MSGTATERLRELVADYYHGLLTLESYREQRGQLLDSLDAESPDVDDDDATQTRKRPQPDFDPETVAGIERQLEGAGGADDGQAAEPLKVPSGGRGKWLAAAAGLVVVAGIGTYAFWPATPGPGSERAVIPAAPAPTLSPAESMIDQFLLRSDWSGAGIDQLSAGWAALSDAEQQAARETAVFRRMNDSLQRRFREEEALSDGNQTPTLLALLALAEDLELAFAANIRDRLNGTGRSAPVEPGDAVAVPAVSAVSAPPGPAPESPADVVPAAPEATGAAVVSEAEESAPPPPGEAGEPPQAATAAGSGDETAPAVGEPAVAEESVPGEAETVAADPGDDACREELAATRRPYCQDTLASGSAGPPLVVLGAGQFTMGSDEVPEEGPTRVVTIPAAFAMSLYEVSVREFREFCERTNHPCVESDWGDDDDPVVGVSWNDAAAYADWLSGETSYAYALPSEAEWEYAARAGTDTPYFFGKEITPSAAHSAVNGNADSPVGRGDSAVNRNEFRLLHMAGNVREWVADAWHDNYSGAPSDGSVWDGGDADRRVVRGGSFADPPDRLRSAARASLPAAQRDAFTGIRVVRRLER